MLDSESEHVTVIKNFDTESKEQKIKFNRVKTPFKSRNGQLISMNGKTSCKNRKKQGRIHNYPSHVWLGRDHI